MTLGTIKLPTTLRSIQLWRLVHALSEGSYEINIKSEYADGVAYLSKYFPVNLRTGDGSAVADRFIEADTLAPSTRFGSVRRPLILPHAVTGYCRALWPTERHVDYSFVGLSHWGRSKTLSDWYYRQFQIRPHLRQIGDRQSIDDAISATERTANGLLIVLAFSKRGRAYPMKLWDDDYHRSLAASKFTLCPDGDQIWSYRFFEAILCGSMPVVQTQCDIYNGFHYLKLSESISDHNYSEQLALDNFNRCMELLTVSRDDIDAELSRSSL